MKPTNADVLERRAVFARVKRALVAVVIVPEQVEGGTKSVTLRAETVGTGFVVDTDGLIITNHHVVEKIARAHARARTAEAVGPPRLLVLTPTHCARLRDGREIDKSDARIVSHIFHHPPDDLALMVLRPEKLPSASPLHAVSLATEPCHDGDEVAFVGFPLGKHLHEDLVPDTTVTPSFSRGIVSNALTARSETSSQPSRFQLHAMVNGGNSGGPVFDPKSGAILGVIRSAKGHKLAVVLESYGVHARDDSDPPTVLPYGIAEAVHAARVKLFVEQTRRVVRPDDASGIIAYELELPK